MEQCHYVLRDLTEASISSILVKGKTESFISDFVYICK